MSRLLPKWHSLPKLHSLPESPVLDVGAAPSQVSSHASAPVVLTEHEALTQTAAVVPVPPATAHRHRPGAALVTAVGHIHLRLPEPRPIYPRREPSYFDTARMSRMMEHP